MKTSISSQNIDELIAGITLIIGNRCSRVIRPSSGRLKEIQRSIRIHILSKIQLPEVIQGSFKGKSNISNAKQHQTDFARIPTTPRHIYQHSYRQSCFLENGSEVDGSLPTVSSF
jgi:hypothetical protein